MSHFGAANSCLFIQLEIESSHKLCVQMEFQIQYEDFFSSLKLKAGSESSVA